MVYSVDADTTYARQVKGDCLFKLITPEDVETDLENQIQKYGEELREMTPLEIEGKLE